MISVLSDVERRLKRDQLDNKLLAAGELLHGLIDPDAYIGEGVFTSSGTGSSRTRPQSVREPRPA